MSNPFTNETGSQRVSTPVALGILAFASVCVCCVSALLFRHIDPSGLVQFVSGVIPSTIGVIVLASQNRKTQAKVEHAEAVAVQNNTALSDVKEAVNGNLTAQFSEIHDRLDAAGIPKSSGESPAEGRHEASA